MFPEGFLDYAASGGLIVYPLVLVGLVSAGYAVAAFRRLRSRDEAADARLLATIDGVIFWAGFAVLLGVLGTVLGVVQMAAAVQGAGGAAPGLVWGGVYVVLSPTVLALLLFGPAAVAWYVLRRGYARRFVA